MISTLRPSIQAECPVQVRLFFPHCCVGWGWGTPLRGRGFAPWYTRTADQDGVILKGVIQVYIRCFGDGFVMCLSLTAQTRCQGDIYSMVLLAEEERGREHKDGREGEVKKRRGKRKNRGGLSRSGGVPASSPSLAMVLVSLSTWGLGCPGWASFPSRGPVSHPAGDGKESVGTACPRGAWERASHQVGNSRGRFSTRLLGPRVEDRRHKAGADGDGRPYCLP